jgi:RNA polymerase-interacting CarD/CdnL/TRCF family regulator
VAKKSTSLGKDDWIVHTYYGVGQITGIETKQIEDTKTKYYRVKAKNSIFFVPVKNIDNERIRPIATQYMMRKVKKVLQEVPEEMSPDHNIRKREINELLTDCSLATTAQLIRDLTARKIEHNLNDHEEKTLEKLTDRLVLEWSIAQKIELEKANQQFQDTLQKGIDKIKPSPFK